MNYTCLISQFQSLPIHCACINPNVKYLSALMSVCPEYDMPDKRNRRPVHYAAACETTATLEYLVSHGARTEEFDTAGMTPLMIACETGRMHNVEFLLKKAKESSEKPEDEGVAVTTNKFGIGQINRPNKQSYTALHIAIKNGRLDMMKKLLEYGADIKRKLSAGKNRMTSLMIAREVGDFEIIKYLNELNVPIEQTDKLGRTALIHAVLNGHAHITSFLLSLGADPKASDTSGNSCIHYAVAYGWYHCFKLLLEAGANPNQLNDWKMQPLSIAFLKGHRGFVDLLLEQPAAGVDINFPDERGMTLLAVLCSNHLTEDLKNHIQYLVTEEKADCTIKDINGNTCLHHLANQTVTNHSYRGFGRRVAGIDETRMSIST